MIISVQYQADDKVSGTWNTELRDQQITLGFIPDREIQNIMFWKERPRLVLLFQKREKRRQLIREHFAACADKLIDQIEAKEKWSEFKL